MCNFRLSGKVHLSSLIAQDLAGQKIDYTTGLSLGGAEFTLTSSDLETEVTITKTSSAVNGRLTFDGLESGTYILQETAAPEGYFKDDTPRIVVIKPDNTITIDGLETNDAGNFVIDNKKNGTVTITKKWEDDKANDERPVPVVHLSTTRNATRATFRGSPSVNSREKETFRYFDPGDFQSAFHRYAKSENGFTSVSEITAFKPWEGELPEGITTFRMDDRTTASRILGWFDEGTIYWWSDAQEVYFAKNACLFFNDLTGLTEVDLTGIITLNVTDMYYMFWGCRSLQNVDFSNMDLSNVVDMGYMFSGCSSLTSVSFNGSDASNLINTSSMFSSLYNLKSVDMNGFYTPKLKNMRSMFSGCRNLTSLDLRGMDTSRIIDMSYVFYYCYNLTSIDLSSWDTSNVRIMDYMFCSCRNLEAINLSGFDTSNVTNMERMFSDCWNLTSLDLSSWDTSSVKNTSSMFNYCPRISVIKVSELWNMDAVTNSSDMFRSCSRLRGGQGTGYNSSYTDKTYARIDDRNNGNPGYFTEKSYTGSVGNVDRDYVNLTNAFINNTKNNSSAVSFMRFTGEYDDIQQLVEEGTAVRVDDTTRDKQAYIWYDTDNQIIYWWSDAEKAYLPSDCSQMFYGNNSLTSIDFGGLDTSRVTQMSYMFYNCSALTNIDFSGFDTSNVTDMNNMFYNCSGLTSLDLSGFDTSCVTRMDYMFSGCRGLTSIKLSGFDTSFVSNMSYLFYNCSSLTSIDLSGFDTSFVTNMSYLFYNCSSLTSIDLSGFKTSTVSNMSYMFYNCSSLTSIDISSFDTSSSRSLCCLFYGCSGLTSLDVSNFDTSNVGNFGCLFCGCTSLVTLDLSNFNTSSASMAYSMFYNCTNLTTIYVSERWNLYNKTLNDGDYTNVFNGSLKLVGEKGTRSADYDLGWERGIQYARIDDPENGHPGFLTYKAAGGDNGIHYISDTESADGVRMADGGETGGASCTIDKNAAENTWTYTFTGINDTVEYYVWEDVPEGYTGSATETNAGKVTEGRFTITNTSPNAPKYGDLKISKTLSAADGAALIDADYEMQFIFTVLLTDENGEAVTGSRFFGNVPFVDGRAVIRIRSDRTSPEEDNGVMVTDIPEGWHYTVTEATAEGFILTAHTGDEGVIDADSVKAAVFNNAKQREPEPVPTVNVTLTKTVQGVFDETEDSFEFMASITGLKPRETYIYTRNGDEVEYTSDRTGSADLRLSLSSGDVIIFEELPVNSVYRFIEQAGDYIASYVVTDSNGLDKIASTKGANLEENLALSTAAETADENENVTVSFLNRIIKTQDLTLKKLVRPSSDSNNDPFSFTLEIEGLDPEAVIETDVGQMRADSNGAIEAHFTMKDGQTVMLYALPVRSKYRITEAASSYIASYVINDSNNLGRILRSSDDNGTETDKALSTQLETVDQGEEAEITFINTKLSHDITVSKKLDMTYGDTTSFNYKAQRFLFKVVFSGLTAGRTYTLSRTSEDMIGFTADSTNYEYEFELRDGEALTFRDIEENVLYTVTELYDENDPVVRRCIPSYEIKSNSEAVTAKLTDSLNEAGELSTATETVDHTDYDVNIIFTNQYIFTPYVLPNSGFKDVRPVLILAGAGIILFAIMFATSRNHKRKKAS